MCANFHLHISSVVNVICYPESATMFMSLFSIITTPDLKTILQLSLLTKRLHFPSSETCLQFSNILCDCCAENYSICSLVFCCLSGPFTFWTAHRVQCLADMVVSLVTILVYVKTIDMLQEYFCFSKLGSVISCLPLLLPCLQAVTVEYTVQHFVLKRITCSHTLTIAPPYGITVQIHL